MTRRPFSTLIVVVALIAAIAVWIGYAFRAIQADGGIEAASDRSWLVGIVLLGCAFDVLVAVRLVWGRVGLGGLIWLALRVLLSIGGFLYLTLPLYAIAFFVLSRAPRTDPRADPLLPHEYRPISAGWFGALTPLWWSRNILGASQIGASQCVVCQEDRDAPIHGAVA